MILKITLPVVVFFFFSVEEFQDVKNAITSSVLGVKKEVCVSQDIEDEGRFSPFSSLDFIYFGTSILFHFRFAMLFFILVLL